MMFIKQILSDHLNKKMVLSEVIIWNSLIVLLKLSKNKISIFCTYFVLISTFNSIAIDTISCFMQIQHISNTQIQPTCQLKY